MFKEFYQLFKRAPLWRLSLLLSFLSGLSLCFFPTIALKKIFPFLPGAAFIAPLAAKKPLLHPTQEAQNTQSAPLTDQVIYPNLDHSFTHHITLGSYDIPLPKGQWHPILQVQTPNSFPILFLSLIRLENNHVTGMIFAQTTVKNAPLSLEENIQIPCHDDRNLILARSEKANHADCLLLQPALLNGLDLSDDNFINDTLARLRMSGIVPPPFMLAVSWRHMVIQSPIMGNFISVDTLLPPLDPHTHSPHLLGSFEAWQNHKLSPQATYFLKRLTSWLKNWYPILEASSLHHLPENFKNNEDKDPLAPR